MALTRRSHLLPVPAFCRYDAGFLTGLSRAEGLTSPGPLRSDGTETPMIPTPPKPRFEPGTRVRATQRVRVGHREWSTQIVGIVEREGVRPVGGMEMGGKGLYCRQSTIRLRREDGEIIDVALDEWTKFEVLSSA